MLPSPLNSPPPEPATSCAARLPGTRSVWGASSVCGAISLPTAACRVTGTQACTQRVRPLGCLQGIGAACGAWAMCGGEGRGAHRAPATHCIC
eukprot:2949618-Prymnesium_polylepis.1